MKITNYKLCQYNNVLLQNMVLKRYLLSVLLTHFIIFYLHYFIFHFFFCRGETNNGKWKSRQSSNHWNRMRPTGYSYCYYPPPQRQKYVTTNFFQIYFFVSNSVYIRGFFHILDHSREKEVLLQSFG